VFRQWVRREVVVPVVQLLRQGTTPEKIALSIAIGAVLGSMPFIGVTTALCFVIASLLRLNLVAIQLVNYLMYPVQLILFVPFIRAGERLYRANHLALTVGQIDRLLHTNLTQAVEILWTAMWHALTVWAVVAPLAVGIIYLLLTPVIRRMALRLRPDPEF